MKVVFIFGSYSLEPELAGATYAHRLSHKSFFCSVTFSSMHTAVRILLEIKEEVFWCISAAETVTGLLRTLEWSEAVITHNLSPPTFTVTLPYTEVCLNVLPWVCTAQQQLLQRFKGAHCVPEPLSTGSDIQTVRNSLLSFFSLAWCYSLRIFLFLLFLRENYIDSISERYCICDL